MEVDLGDVLALEWSPRPPAGNVVAFIAAGLTLRRMHRRAQRGDGDDPPAALDDHDPVIEVPANRTDEAPDYESQASDEAILLQGLNALTKCRLASADAAMALLPAHPVRLTQVSYNTSLNLSHLSRPQAPAGVCAGSASSATTTKTNAPRSPHLRAAKEACPPGTLRTTS